MEKNNNEFYEGCGKEGPIKCIFYCEFHPTAGPKIACQVPPDFISKDTFEAVSVYLITKAQLLRSMITITTCGIKILGFPVRIDNKKYARNAFYFNVCFVCDSWARTAQFESVVKKLSDFLTGLEVESSFLSQRENNHNGEKLVHMLGQVLTDLNLNGMCTLTEGSSSTHLKVIKLKPDPPPVHDHQVPVFIEELGAFHSELWDLTTQQILPFIDGINHVSKVSALADVENNLVKTCLQNLIYYNVVRMVPIFQYSNSYTVTPKLRSLVINRKLQDDCMRAVARQAGLPLPSFRDVFKMYCAMTPGTTVKDLCLRFNPALLRIDEKKLVQFGLVEGLIRKIHKYPMTIMSNPHGEASPLYAYFTGLLSYDQICCSLGMSSLQLDALIEKDSNVIMIFK